MKRTAGIQPCGKTIRSVAVVQYRALPQAASRTFGLRILLVISLPGRIKISSGTIVSMRGPVHRIPWRSDSSGRPFA